ncbi:MAG: flagellar basal body P-ring formation chaperone FlgA [Gemmatimonadota bacterium]|nr:flagellar basal body P-ring formation chaperone FlgA [Gemmatimonadota bacterium]
MTMLRRLALLAGSAGLLAALASSLAAQAPALPSAPEGMASVAATSTPLALRALPRGTVLQAGDVSGDAALVIGYETQRVVAAGEPLRAPAIAPAAAVRSGDAVTVRVEMNGITVTRLGIALGNARAGAPVRVRIGQHSLSGVAVAPGVVRLP